MELIVQGVNIVLRGQFNAAIFQPAWLAAQGLIRQQEADVATVAVISPRVTIFTTEWLRVNITDDRFQVGTSQEGYYEVLRDLVVAVFDLQASTPVRVLGVNRDFHYRLESEKAWHSLGHRLAPKRVWEGILDQPGMKSLTIEGKRPDEQTGYIQVKVEPSPRVLHGVYVEVNDHYVLSLDGSTSSPAGNTNLYIILSEQWMESMERSLMIANKVVTLGGEG